jgi:hypothetical protein
MAGAVVTSRGGSGFTHTNKTGMERFAGEKRSSFLASLSVKEKINFITLTLGPALHIFLNFRKKLECLFQAGFSCLV